MRVVLELLRILAILFLLGSFAWLLLDKMYIFFDRSVGHKWFGAIAILLLLFVLYRNKLQFSGWNQGSKNVKLPRTMSYLLVISAVILIIMPFFLG